MTPRLNAQDIGVHRMRGLEEATAGALQGTRSAAEISEYFMRQVEQANISEAEQSGMVVSRDPSTGEIQPINLREGASPSTRAFNNAQRVAWVSAASADAASSIKTFAHRALNPVDAMGNPIAQNADPIQAFEKTTAAYIGAIFKDEKMPDGVRSQLVTRVGQLAAEYRTAVVDEVQKRNTARLSGEFSSTMTTNLNEGLARARAGDAAGVERNRQAHREAVDALASINPAFTPDKREAALKSFEATVEFAGIEQEALKRFRSNSGFEQGAMGQKAAADYLEGLRTNLYEKYGQEMADRGFEYVRRVVTLQKELQAAGDAKSRADVQSAAFILSATHSVEFARSIAGDGTDPNAVLKTQLDAIDKLTNNPVLRAQLKAQWTARTADAIARNDPAVAEQDVRVQSIVGDVTLAVKRGEIAPDSVFSTIMARFKSEAIFPSPTQQTDAMKLQNQLALQQQQELNLAAKREATAQQLLAEKIIAAKNVVDNVQIGKTPPTEEAVQSLGFLLEQQKMTDLTNPTIAAFTIASMQRTGNILLPTVKAVIDTAIDKPDAQFLINHKDLLLRLNTKQVSTDILENKYRNVDARTQFGEVIGMLTRYLNSDANAGADEKKKAEALTRFSAELVEFRRRNNERPYASNSEAERKAGHDALNAQINSTFYSGPAWSQGVPVLGWVLNREGVVTVGGRGTNYPSEQWNWMQNIYKPALESISKNVAPLNAVASGAESVSNGIAYVFGSNPGTIPTTAGGMLGFGWMYDKLPVDMSPIDRQNIVRLAQGRAMEFRGDMQQAVNAVFADYVRGREMTPSAYSGHNLVAARQSGSGNKEVRATLASNAIDGQAGEYGAWLARIHLTPLADELVKNGFKWAADNVSSGRDAVGMPQLWKTTFFAPAVQNGVRGKLYTVEVAANVDGRAEYVPVHDAKGFQRTVFVPTVDSATIQKVKDIAGNLAIELANNSQATGTTRSLMIKTQQHLIEIGLLSDLYRNGGKDFDKIMNEWSARNISVGPRQVDDRDQGVLGSVSIPEANRPPSRGEQGITSVTMPGSGVQQ